MGDPVPSFDVTNAKYAGTDVTDRLHAHTINGRLDFDRVHPVTIGVSDPTPGLPKDLQVDFEVDGRPLMTTFVDGEVLSRPPK